MSITEIETAIRKLPAAEVGQLKAWFDEYREQMWDHQVEADLGGGLYDHFIAEALASGEPTPLVRGDIDEVRGMVRERIRERVDLQ